MAFKSLVKTWHTRIHKTMVKAWCGGRGGRRLGGRQKRGPNINHIKLQLARAEQQRDS